MNCSVMSRCLWLFMLISLSANSPGAGLMPVDDMELAQITGQEGVAIDLELRVNADSSGTPLASLDNCSGPGNPCLIALQFGNRTAGGGEWLAIKDLYGVMRFNDLQLDGTRLPSQSSDYANPERFLDQNGTCLIDSGMAAENCSPNGTLAASFSFPETSGFNADIEWFLNVGRMSVQFGEEGYWAANDDGASFVGIRIDDKINDVATIDVGGSIQLFGF